MKIRTVHDLQSYMQLNAASPETVAKVVGLSNMTIRRFLLKPPSSPIPVKYEPLFDRLFPGANPAPELAALAGSDLGFGELIAKIEVEGMQCEDPEVKIQDSLKKAKREKLGSILVLIKELGASISSQGALKSSLRKQAIAVGALLYFLNPIDLIPDTIPVFGYLDDFAVLSIAASVVRVDSEDKTNLKAEKS